MAETKSDLNLNLNGTNVTGTEKNYAAPVRLWNKLQINEWTFSLLLFVISLSIVLGKLYINYAGLHRFHKKCCVIEPHSMQDWLGQNATSSRTQGTILQLQSNSESVMSSTSVFSNISNILDVSRMPDVSEFSAKHLAAASEQFVNIGQYDDVVNVTMSFFKTYGWLIKATISGLIMMGFTWFIIYKDSSIPGINPPSPFSPSKYGFTRESSKVQINYLVGVLNGILIFVYMCL